MMEKVDFLVIGGGILGVSIGNELLGRYPTARVVVAEKENQIGMHASGRNSGVLHAGFYYSADSLKAKFCADGNAELRSVIKKFSIPILECGKVVVAKNEAELAELEKLHTKGLANGVAQEILGAEKLNQYEPLAKTHKAFLWSPTTAVSDPSKVLEALTEKFIALGGDLRVNAEVEVIEASTYMIHRELIRAEQTINVSGTNAIHIAHSLGVGIEYEQLPVLGLYKISTDANLNLKTLVYPVPNPEYPFLGVHFTLTVDGKVKIGPTAIPVLGGEQYSLTSKVSTQDLTSALRSTSLLLRKSPKLLLNLAATEFPNLSTRRLINEASELVPTATFKQDWRVKKPGIRAQLVEKNSGRFVMDFLVQKQEGVTHVLNAVSPGWTAAIPFAKFVVSKYA